MRNEIIETFEVFVGPNLPDTFIALRQYVHSFDNPITEALIDKPVSWCVHIAIWHQNVNGRNRVVYRPPAARRTKHEPALPDHPRRITKFRISVMSSIANLMPSRPKPLSFTPP